MLQNHKNNIQQEHNKMNTIPQTILVVRRYTAALIILLLVCLTFQPVERRWAEAEVWLAGGTVVLLAVGAVLGVMTRRRPAFTVTDALVTVWFAFYAGMIWTDGGGYPCRTEFLHTVVVFLLYFSLRLLFGVAGMSAWMLVVCIIAGGCYEAVAGVEQMVNGTSRHSQYMLTGNFLNPGPYSAYLMMGLAVGLAAMREIGNRKVFGTMPSVVPGRIATMLKNTEWRHVLAVAVLIMAVVLPATWSRDAFVGLAVVALWIYRRHYRRYRFAVWGVLAVASIAFYLVKQGSADGRMIIWQAALTTWLDSPWLGVGTGGFCHAVAEGMARMHECGVDLSSAGVTDNAYNILLKTLVEQGVAGAVLAVALCVSAMISLYRSCRPLFYGMASLLIFSMFSYPFDLLPYKIIVVMTVAWSESSGGKALFAIGRIKTLLMAGMLAFTGKQIYGMVRESYEADSEYAIISGFHNEAFIEDYYELLPVMSDNAEFLFDFGKALNTARRYHDSNDVLRRGTMCSADPMFYVLTGNNYKEMRQYELAEQAYKKAFAVMPNRLYPLYRLMLLYKEQGRQDDCVITAYMIANFKEKVTSEATNEMKGNAWWIIKESEQVCPHGMVPSR